MCRPIGGPIEEQAEWVLGEAMAECSGDVPTDQEIVDEIEWWVADEDKGRVHNEVRRLVAARQKNDENCDIDAVAIDALSWFNDFDAFTNNDLTESLKDYLNDNNMSHKHIDAIVEKFGEHVINAITIYRNAKKESDQKRSTDV